MTFIEYNALCESHHEALAILADLQKEQARDDVKRTIHTVQHLVLDRLNRVQYRWNEQCEATNATLAEVR